MERDDIQDDIRRVASQLGKDGVTMSDYKQHGRFGFNRVLKAYGRWNTAIKAAGLVPIAQGGEGEPSNKVPDDRLAEEFQRVYRQLGKAPTIYEFESLAGLSSNPYERRFGGWRKAVAHYLKSEATAVPRQFTPVILALEPAPAPSSRSDAVERGKIQRLFGPPLNFRELRHEPVNEQGVVLLFGMVALELGFLVEAVGTGYPDCRAKRRVRGKYYVDVDIEFEFHSSNCREHGHDPQKCDLVVCWVHDWPGCPIEVLELKSEIARLVSSV